MVPLDEHSTRVINHAVIVQPLPALVKKLAAARPRWIDHLLLNEIFDGDMAYLAKACTFLSASSPVHDSCPAAFPGCASGRSFLAAEGSFVALLHGSRYPCPASCSIWLDPDRLLKGREVPELSAQGLGWALITYALCAG